MFVRWMSSNIQAAFGSCQSGLDSTVQKVTRPVRIVSLATLPHQRGKFSPEFVVDGPVPKYVFDGRIPSQEASKYVVVEMPDILIPIEPKFH
jgi:hypothetical protein